MAVFQTFFYGKMTPYHVLCLKSFVDFGHEVNVYCYEGTDVPSFCYKTNAEDLISKKEIFFYKDGGSVACFANLFRYEMLYLNGGWWIDSDVLCLREKWDDISDFAIGWESEDFINTAVMKWPAKHPLLRVAADTCWKLKDDVFWGQTGPRYMTYLLGEFDLKRKASDVSRFYPVSHANWRLLFEPNEKTTLLPKLSTSDCLHLWWEMCRRGGMDADALPPAGSYLRSAIEKHSVSSYFATE